MCGYRAQEGMYDLSIKQHVFSTLSRPQKLGLFHSEKLKEEDEKNSGAALFLQWGHSQWILSLSSELPTSLDSSVLSDLRILCLTPNTFTHSPRAFPHGLSSLIDLTSFPTASNLCFFGGSLGTILIRASHQVGMRSQCWWAATVHPKTSNMVSCSALLSAR